MKKSDFSGGTVDKNLPANAGDMGLIPGLGRFHKLQSNQACVPRVLSLCSTTTEAHVPSLCSATRETIAMRSLNTTTRE